MGKSITKGKRLKSAPAVESHGDYFDEWGRQGRLVFDLAGAIMLAIDSKQNVRLINKRGLQVLGCKESEILGKNWFDAAMPEKAKKEVKRVFDSLIAGEAEAAEYFENPVITKSGQERIIAWHNTVLTDKEGKIAGTLSSGEDITEKIKASEELKVMNRKLEVLYRASIEWSEAKSLNDVLDKISRCIVEELGYLMVWVGLIEKDTKEVKPVFSMGFEDGYLSSIKVKFNDSSLGTGPTGMCIKSGSPEVMKNIAEDPKFRPWKQEAAKRGYKSSAALPLLCEGKVIGALNIYSGAEDAFAENEVETLKALSVHAASAIKNAILVEKVQKGEKEWEETFNAIEIPIFIHDKELRVIKANRAYIEKSGLKEAEIAGRPYFEVFPKLDGPLPSCKNAVHAAAPSKKTEEIKTAAGEVFISEEFPLMEGEETAAYVHVVRDITKLTMAQKRAEDEAEISTSLLNLANSIGGLLDMRAILEEVSKTTIRLVSAERTAAFLKGETEESFKVAVFHGWPEYLAPQISSLRIRRGDMPAIDAIFKGEDVFTENVQESDMISGDFKETFGLRAVIMSPLTGGGGVVGAILAERNRPFSERDKHIIKGIAANAAVSVENAILYMDTINMSSDLARRMETIRTTYDIDRSILSSLKKEEILDVTTNNIQRIIPADRVITVRYDEREKSYGFDSLIMTAGGAPFLDSVFKASRVASIPDIAQYRHQEPFIRDLLREGFNSLISLPLHAKGRMLGCIIMLSKRVGAFDKDDIANGEKLTAQVAVAMDNAIMYEDLQELFLSTVKALSHAIDAKSPWTKGHSERVTSYAVEIARKMGLPEKDIGTLRVAGLLHDIGKIGTYDDLLDKPGKLTEAEFELVKKHPSMGAEIIGHVKQLAHIIPVVRHHHERIDGGGYPDGLKGQGIPLLARILCVADSFDSMTADRPYRPAPGKTFAISELKRCSGTQFDPEVAEVFINFVG